MSFRRVGKTGSARPGIHFPGKVFMSAAPPLLRAGPDLPFNYMSFSEDWSKWSWLTGGTGAAIPHVFSAGASITVGSKQALPDLTGGEAGKGFTCTGLCQDPDSTDLWVGNFGAYRGDGGGGLLPQSIVRVSANGQTYVSQVLTVQGIGGLQGVAFVTTTSLRCLAYVSGANNNIYFVNRDGTIPRGPLGLGFTPNALTWDDARQGFWVGDTSNGDVWLIDLNGNVLAYADFNAWGGPLDHLTVDTSRGTGGYLWGTSGPNGSPGVLLAWDIAKDQLVNRWTLSDAQAVEGLLVSANTLKIVTDGYYHFFGAAPNTIAPYNVNELQTYTIPSVTQWQYSRIYKAQDITGPYGRQPYHLILDRGAGNTSSDFAILTRDADSSINGQTVMMSWIGRSFDPAGTANLGLRILSGASLTSKAFGATYSRQGVTNTFSNAANNTQIGTRGTQTPDNVVNAVGTGLAVNLGSSIVAYKARLGA